VTPRASDRPTFELLRFSAVPVSDKLVVVEVDGRLAAGSGRFARRPLLVVGGERQLELAPLGSAGEHGRWWGTFALPADIVARGEASFALRVPGALFELPAPDRPADGDRFVELAREANRLRRALEVSEDDARTAREAVASAAHANEEAIVRVREQLDAVEREAAERSRDERARRAALEARIAEREAAHTDELRRRDTAASELQDRLDAQRAEQRELRKQLRAVRGEVEALRRERAAAPPPEAQAEPEDPTTLAPPEDPTTLAPPEALAPTESVKVIGRAPRAIDPVPAIPPEHAAPLDRVGPDPARWIAFAALATFLVVLLYLVFVS